MSKSLNFVVSIRLDKRSSNANGDYPIKLRVWNRASKKVKLYSCNRFTNPTLFDKAINQGTTVKGETFKLRVYLERVLSNASDVLENNNVKSFKDIEKYMFNRTDDSKDDKLSKLKFIYSIDGIVKNLREVVQNNCVDLIIVDSYADLFTGSMNNSNEVRSFLNLYDGIVKEFGVTIVFLHHTKKASAGAAPNKNSILGSQGFEAKMRSVMMLTKDKEDTSLRHLCVVKNNYMPEANKKEGYVLSFSEQLSFSNTGERVQLNDLADDDWLDEARKLSEEGKSLKETAEILKSKGIKTSKSSLDRKLKE